MFCRLCEMEWHLKNHDLCIKQIKRVSEATGHTINIPAHWTLDTDTEEKVVKSFAHFYCLPPKHLIACQESSFYHTGSVVLWTRAFVRNL